MSTFKIFFAGLLLGMSWNSWSLDNLTADTIERLTVSTSSNNLVGNAISASHGSISDQEFQFRPLLRNGELLELIPGLIATQHSGSGKANQLFLRGFNLDHGTDFATFFDGMPVNLRSHGHGQGYTDLNFIIAETVKQIDFKKGPYYTEVGDFSGAGSAHFVTHNRDVNNFVTLTLGQQHYYRSVLRKQFELNHNSSIWAAVELQSYDGSWSDINEDVQKKNALIKFTHSTEAGNWSLSFMGYDNSWNGADQIPMRAVERGLIDRLGSVNTSTGGESSRYSVNLIWDSELLSFNAYAIDYQLQLFSDFTYFLDKPEKGDQFEQLDSRYIYGFNIHKHFEHAQGRTTLGFNTQYDDINEVGLFTTESRARQSPVRLDKVQQYSASAYINHNLALFDKLLVNVGARYDYHRSDVRSKISVNVHQVDVSQNKGTVDDDLISLKANIAYSLNDNAELYVSAGQGFHSNDARGTASFVDPLTGLDSAPVDPLVRSHGSEVGLQWTLDDTFNASIALWQLSLDSELIFVGDAGNTEASLASQRSGLELTAFWRVNDIVTLDGEYAQSNARFKGGAPQENNVPGALDRVIQLGISAQSNGLEGSIRMRHVGARTLEQNGEVRSEPSTTVNALVAYTWQNIEIKAEVLNLFNSKDHDVDYFYTSRLQGEPLAGIEDIHFHPLAPRNLRVSLLYQF